MERNETLISAFGMSRIAIGVGLLALHMVAGIMLGGALRLKTLRWEGYHCHCAPRWDVNT